MILCIKQWYILAIVVFYVYVLFSCIGFVCLYFKASWGPRPGCAGVGVCRARCDGDQIVGDWCDQQLSCASGVITDQRPLRKLLQRHQLSHLQLPDHPAPRAGGRWWLSKTLLLPSPSYSLGTKRPWIKYCRYFTLLIGAIQRLNSEVKIYYFSHLIFQTISLISAIKHFTLFRLESIFGCQGERPPPIHKVDTTVTPMWQEAKAGLGGQPEWHCTRR